MILSPCSIMPKSLMASPTAWRRRFISLLASSSALLFSDIMATGLIERAAIIRENHEFWVVLLAKAFIPIRKLPEVSGRNAAVCL